MMLRILQVEVGVTIKLGVIYIWLRTLQYLARQAWRRLSVAHNGCNDCNCCNVTIVMAVMAVVHVMTVMTVVIAMVVDHLLLTL